MESTQSTHTSSEVDETSILHEDVRFYLQSQKTLGQRHPNRFVLIRDKSVSGVFDTRTDAIDAGYDRFGKGPYLVVKAGDDIPTISNPALSAGVPLAGI